MWQKLHRSLAVQLRAKYLCVLAKPSPAATEMRQSTIPAGAGSCHPAAPHWKEWVRVWVQVRQLSADAELLQEIPYRYFLQLGNYFWPEVLHILADSSCCNSFVLLATRCFVLCSGNSLPKNHHRAGRAQRWLRGEQQQMRTHTRRYRWETVVFFS